MPLPSTSYTPLPPIQDEVSDLADNLSDLSPDDLQVTDDEAAGSEWGGLFWVMLSDPGSGQAFFANPQTGECAWEVPPGTFVLPRSVKGEWWELWDAGRSLPYYFHSLSLETTWHRPKGFVVPLIAVQQSVSHRPLSEDLASWFSSSAPESAGASLSRSTSVHDEDRSQTISPSASDISFADLPSPTTTSSVAPSSTTHSQSNSISSSWPSSPRDSGPVRVRHTTVSFEDPPAVANGTQSKRENGSSSKNDEDRPEPRSPNTASPSSSDAHSIAESTSTVHAMQSSSMSSVGSTSPRSMSRSAFSDLVASPQMPPNKLAWGKKSLFRRQVDLEKLLRWQKEPITTPLLSLTRPARQQAIACFKSIQHIMGDQEADVWRDLPVGSIWPRDISTEAQELLQAALSRGELRDEVYLQLLKQLNRNPSLPSTFRGLQLLIVALDTFPPSNDVESYLRAFIDGLKNEKSARQDLMSHYCAERLDAIIERGPRSVVPSLAEIETASEAAFFPSPFGSTLATIMLMQRASYPDARLPIILPFLSRSLLGLGALKTPGIFKVNGDKGLVEMIKLRVAKGHYDLTGVDDVHAIATLLRTWLRELDQPLFPTHAYPDCIAAAVAEDVPRAIRAVQTLPAINKRCVAFVVSLLQLFAAETKSTNISTETLAAIFATSFVRAPMQPNASLAENMKHSRSEQDFLRMLITHLRPDSLETGAQRPPPPPPLSPLRSSASSPGLSSGSPRNGLNR